MGSVTIPPVEQARSIFHDLGYTVSGSDVPTDFRAERGWKVVHVSAVSDPDEANDASSEGLRCFVTHRDCGRALRRRLQRSDPDFEWAIITIDGNEGYDVVRAPPTSL